MSSEQLSYHKEKNSLTDSLPISIFDYSRKKNTDCKTPPILDLLANSQVLHSILVSLQCTYNPHDACFSIDDSHDTFRIVQLASGVADFLYIHCPDSFEPSDATFETAQRLKSILELLQTGFCSDTGKFRVSDEDMFPLITMAAELSDRLIQQFDVQ